MSDASINIINRALIKLGQPPVASIGQAPNGTMWGLLYIDQRDLLLADYFWRFAMKTADLAPDADKPLSTYKYAYTLPADFISLFKFGIAYKQPNYSNNIIMSDERYSIEGNKILCDVPDVLRIMYTARVEDDKFFSPWFREALVARMAAEMAARLKQSVDLQRALNQEFASYLERAEANDAIMRDTETIGDSSWVGIREGWRNDY